MEKILSQQDDYEQLTKSELIFELRQLKKKLKKTENQNIEQSIFYKRIIESPNHPFNIIDSSTGEILIANSSTLKLIDESENCFLYYDENNKIKILENSPSLKVKKTLKPSIYEWKYKDKKGVLHWLEIHNHPIFDKNGKVSKIIQYMLDITDRKNIKYTLELANKQHENLVKLLPCAIMEFNKSGIITHSNPMYDKMIGYNTGELTGKSFFSLFINKQEANNIKAYLKQILKTQIKPKSFILSNKTKDNQLIDIRLTWNYKKNIDGKIEGFIAHVTNITQEKKQIIENSKLINIVKRASEHIIITDANGKIEYVNDAFKKSTGYSFDDVCGKNPSMLCSKNSLYIDDYYKNLWETIISGNVWHGEFLNTKKNGEDYAEKASIFPIYDETNTRITHFGAINTDVTEDKKIRQELKESYVEMKYLKIQADSANRLKSEFIANVSHDIRNPLNGILGFANLIKKSQVSNQVKTYADKIVLSGNMLLRLINDLLDFSRIEAGQIKIANKTFNLNNMIKDIRSMFELDFENSKVAFNIRFSNLPELVFNDELRIKQIVINLISNALKFTDSGKVDFNILFNKQKDKITIKIIDTGRGIAEEDKKNIFKPFIQSGTIITGTKKGTGLGLSICKKLSDLLNANISLSSKTGKGSTFTFVFPANLKKTKTPLILDIVQYKHPNEISNKTENTILVAEDNPVNIDIITEFLKIAGFNSIISATNGREVIDIALDKKPDLILMDVQMPIIDGLTAVKILREKNYKKPIIMLSAFAMQSDIDEGINCGANAYVTKPINFSSFFHYIDSFLNKKNAEKPDKTFLFKKGLSDNIKNIFLGDVRKKLVIINDINSKNKIRDNLEEIRIITHGYKGNAKYFGFSKLEDISIAITNAIEDNVKSEKLKPLVSKLIDILEKIVITNN